MDMKFVLVLVSTMFLVATAWPSPWERDEVMNFNEMANVEQNYPICTSLVKVIVSGKQYDLEGCQSAFTRRKCIKGLPHYPCFGSGSDCEDVIWHDSIEFWQTQICKLRSELDTVDCYNAVSNRYNCDIMFADAQKERKVDCVCTAKDGKKVCNPPNCDASLRVPKKVEAASSECECVEDPQSGEKACIPANCDSARHTF